MSDESVEETLAWEAEQGTRAGAEVAQLYLGFPINSGEPPRQLRGFKRLQLAPAQAGHVTFRLFWEDLAIWDVENHRWKVPIGTFQVYVGASSRDIRLTGQAKTFSLDDVRPGRPAVSLEALRGKPVVLNFFGSWCGPCVREMPALQAMSERYKGRVQFVGVTFNDSRDSARSLLDRSGVTYPAAFDAKSDLAYDYGIQGMPTTLFIGPDGNLVEGKKGEFSEPQLQAVIGRLFGSLPVAKSR